MRERLRRYLPLLGYTGFYLFVFFVACYFVFPYSVLRDRIVAEVQKQRGRDGSGWTLEMDDLGPSWVPFGIHANGVRLSMIAKPSTSGESEAPPGKLEFEGITAHLGILVRLFGITRVTFSAQGLGGDVAGLYKDSSSERLLELNFEDVLLSRLGPLTALTGVPLGGVGKGSLEFRFPERKYSKGDGSLHLTLQDAAVGDGKTAVQGLTLPKVMLGEVKLDLEGKEGIVRLEKLAASGSDIELAGEGKITLRDNLADSNSDLYLRFKINDKYRGKDDKTKALFGDPGSTIPGLFEVAVPKVKQSKRADGFYGWHLTGAMDRLRSEPFAGNPPGSTASAPAKKP